jgi:hypothetical protein
MKIEQLLVQHFYNNREVTLQGMGTFTLSPDFVLPMETDKDVVMPENAISFTFNSKATEDEALINFIVHQTRKIKPLASADLDSYLMLGRQFLNIGKPFKIEGLGIIEKNQQGDYEFKQGHFANSKLEAALTELKEKAEDDISFAAKRNPSGIPGKNILLIIACIVVLAIAGWAAWHFFTRKKEMPRDVITQPQKPLPSSNLSKDTSKPVAPKTDTTVKLPSVVNTTDGYTFKIVFRENLDKASAISKMNDLVFRGHKVIMYTKDSIYYKLAEPFTRPISDTARIRDSLNRFFYSGRAHVEL